MIYIRSSIPPSVYTTVHSSLKKMKGWGFVYLWTLCVVTMVISAWSAWACGKYNFIDPWSQLTLGSSSTIAYVGSVRRWVETIRVHVHMQTCIHTVASLIRHVYLCQSGKYGHRVVWIFLCLPQWSRFCLRYIVTYTSAVAEFVPYTTGNCFK